MLLAVRLIALVYDIHLGWVFHGPELTTSLPLDHGESQEWLVSGLELRGCGPVGERLKWLGDLLPPAGVEPNEVLGVDAVEHHLDLPEELVLGEFLVRVQRDGDLFDRVELLFVLLAGAEDLAEAAGPDLLDVVEAL